MPWNEESTDLLKKLWAEGLSSSQIASRLDGVTRNAVVGKVHRLGLSGRATTSRMKNHGPKQVNGHPWKKPRGRQNPSHVNKQSVEERPRSAQIGNPVVRALYYLDAEPFVAAVEELDIPLAERKSIDTLVECSCRWPIGDPQHVDFHFCGKKKIPELPYCEFHARRAFQPSSVKTRAKQPLSAAK